VIRGVMERNMPTMRMPSWTTTAGASVCEVGPWRIELVNDLDPDGAEVGWAVDLISGPLVPADERYWPDVADMDLPEMQALMIRYVADLAAALSALQPYLR